MIKWIKTKLGSRREGEKTSPDPMDVTHSLSEHGIMKKSFTLFNTITDDQISPNMRASIRTQKNNIRPEDIRYRTMPKDLPNIFDPRTPDGVPPSQQPYWFYKTSDGKTESVLTIPLDQSRCGSCWSFSSSSMFTDIICISLLKRYGERACKMSSLFVPILACTGATGIENPETGGVTNAEGNPIYGVADTDRISEYWTAGFAPKMREKCPVVGFETCTHDICQKALPIWRDAARGGKLDDVHKALGDKFGTCMGCEGNHIAMPLIMFCDPDAGSASLLSSFPLSEWVCLFGSPELQKKFCPPDFFRQSEVVELPKTYHADKYSYVTAEDFDAGNKPPGINSMEEWIKATIYNYGPVTIGFNVYDTFGKFFNNHRTEILTFEDFRDDFQKNPGANPLGGHAVVIIGWGEEQRGSKITPYWVVRNSWGVRWGDKGYFRIERNIDQKLAAAGFRQRVNFEHEFGTVFFAPDPNPELYSGGIQNNPMTEYLLETPMDKCYSYNHVITSAAEAQKKCLCPKGYVMHGDDKHCVADPNGEFERMLFQGIPMSSKLLKPHHYVILVIVLLIIIAIVFRKHLLPRSVYRGGDEPVCQSG